MQAGGLEAIEKNIKWKIVFLGAALITVSAGIISTLFFMFHILQPSTWSPCSFLSALFLLGFGFLMTVLDAPMNNAWMLKIKKAINTFALFLTRFTGRGMWYLFLSTQVWLALYDHPVARWIAWIFTPVLLIIGIAALVKGFRLSSTLQKIREGLKDRQTDPQHFMSRGGVEMTKDEFKKMCVEISKNPDLLNEDDLDYVMNALVFRPGLHEDVVTLEEFKYWMKGGPMTLV